MVTVKRLYIYGVLGISLVLLLWGLADLVRFVLDEFARILGASPAITGSFAREELSRAVALVLVAGGIFGAHLALVRRLLRGTPAEIADERASLVRSTYFFLVFVGAGAAALWSGFQALHDLIGSATFASTYELDPIGAFAAFVVFGGAWASHLLARRRDLRAVPERLAGDPLTRAYIYGALFVVFVIAAVDAGDTLTVLAREALGLTPVWEGPASWQEAVAAPLAATIVAASAWLLHWRIAEGLRSWPDPVGVAHRVARTRRGYLLGVVAASTFAVLVFASVSLGNILAEMLGTWRSTDGSRLIEDVGGPLLMLVPFVPAWWWHQRRASSEAYGEGGPLAARMVARATRLVIAFVGLAGLSLGVAWELQILIDALAGSDAGPAITLTSLGGDESRALAVALVGLVLWAPSWVASQHERAHHVVEAATSTSRRAYLMLVSGLAVIAAMGSLAYLVWQAARVLLESGELDDPSWAMSIFVVAAGVLAYHLWQLRSDTRIAPLVEPRAEQFPPAGATAPAEDGRALETIEISAPVGADFRVLNAAIRSELPDGYELRVVSHRP